MTTAKELNYSLHHLCIYDDNPRENMMPYLRWHHAITNYFSGAVFHVTGEGHSDYTFMGVGGHAYQIQIEAPPFQYEYERNWWADHGKGYNHVCWITSNARASHQHLLDNGATHVMPFEEFPTYDGFVVKDPEDKWIEVMEYTDENFRVNELTHAPSGECGLEMIGNASTCRDVSKMRDWYIEVMDFRLLEEFQDGVDHVVMLTDKDYQAETRRSLFILQNARTEDQKARFNERGAYISEIVYQAKDVQRAWDDALWAGFEALEEPSIDKLTGLLTAYLKEPCGKNTIMLTEYYSPDTKL